MDETGEMKRAFVSLLLACVALGACHAPNPSGRAQLSTSLKRVVPCLAPASGPAHVRRDEDLVVLVHGCNSSIAKFKNLAEVFRSRGQQAACFTYDDRDSLISVARELNVALDALRGGLGTGRVTLIGHSQGGLIARYAATAVDQTSVQVTQLITISSPFSGIHSARDCGLMPLHILTLGITVGVCQVIAGRKWTEIHERAPFMLAPPALAPEVQRHLAVLTDETGTCLVAGETPCKQPDVIFSLQEQALNYVYERRVQREVVKAGHTAIVGEEGRVPLALIGLLEEEGVLQPARGGDWEQRQAELEGIYRGNAWPAWGRARLRR